MQLIMLLSHLGISDGVFLELLKANLESLSAMFVNEEIARSKLLSVSCGINWEQLSEANFVVTMDPYFRSMLMALYRFGIDHTYTDGLQILCVMNVGSR